MSMRQRNKSKSRQKRNLSDLLGPKDCIPTSQLLNETQSFDGKKRRREQRLVQLHLDFGQSDFSSTVCKECGMRFTPGCEKDEKMHKKYHHSYINQSVSFKPGKKDLLLFRGEDGHSIVRMEFPSGSMKTNKTICALCDVMERDFQSSLSEILKEDQRIYLYLRKSDIIGCLVLESVTSGIRMVPKSTQQSEFEETRERRCAQCGVVIIWVTPKFRRQSIASTLLDIARQHFIFGYCIPKDQLAFLQPTSKGQKFADHYTNGHLLIY